jgi:hypothetical protein
MDIRSFAALTKCRLEHHGHQELRGASKSWMIRVVGQTADPSAFGPRDDSIKLPDYLHSLRASTTKLIPRSDTAAGIHLF